MIKHFFYLLIAGVSFVCTAQQQADSLRFSGTFVPKDRAAAYIVVYGNLGQEAIVGESKVTDGAFTMHLPNSLAYGVYKLGFGMQEKPNLYLVHEPEVKAYTVTIENNIGCSSVFGNKCS